MIDDLRGFIQTVDGWGQCKVVENADWNLEIGSIAEVIGQTPDSPALLFDSIKGYRIVTNALATPR